MCTASSSQKGPAKKLGASNQEQSQCKKYCARLPALPIHTKIVSESAQSIGSFFSFQSFPAKVMIGDWVFVGVTLTTSDPNLKLVVPECWATPTEDPNQQPQYYFIQKKYDLKYECPQIDVQMNLEGKDWNAPEDIPVLPYFCMTLRQVSEHVQRNRHTR